jgi:hypothetical protein
LFGRYAVDGVRDQRLELRGRKQLSLRRRISGDAQLRAAHAEQNSGQADRD